MNQPNFIGAENLTGKRMNSLEVLSIATLHPISYRVRCEKCEAEFTRTHVELRYGKGCKRGIECDRSARSQERKRAEEQARERTKAEQEKQEREQRERLEKTK